MKKILLYFTNKYFGEWEKIYSALNNKEIVPKKYYMNTIMSKNYISVIDDNYPDELKTIYKPPFSLFWYGNLSLINEKLIGLYGYSNNKSILNNLLKIKNGIYIIDYDNYELINILIEKKINFIAINKNGINNSIKKTDHYQNIVNNNNLIITEIPKNNIKTQFWDQIHNRIIFGLSKRMIFLDNKNQYNFGTIIELCKLESISCYSFDDFENDYVTCIKDVNKLISKTLMN